MQFTLSLGGALSLCIAQTIFVSRLRFQILQDIPDVPVDMVIAAGAYGLADLSRNSPEKLLALRKAYNNALRDVFIFALAAGGVALIFSLFFEHRNLKLVAKERE